MPTQTSAVPEGRICHPDAQYALAVTLGHAHWSMRHSHTSATSTNWEKKRADIMAKPPPTGGARGVFYPHCMLPHSPQTGGTQPLTKVVEEAILPGLRAKRIIRTLKGHDLKLLVRILRK
jgi:hypothetical protein